VLLTVYFSKYDLQQIQTVGPGHLLVFLYSEYNTCWAEKVHTINASTSKQILAEQDGVWHPANICFDVEVSMARQLFKGEKVTRDITWFDRT